MRFHPAGSCWQCIYLHIWTYLLGSYTSRSRLSIPGYHPHPLSVRIPLDGSERESRAQGEISTRERASQAVTTERCLIPNSNMCISIRSFLFSPLSRIVDSRTEPETSSDQNQEGAIVLSTTPTYPIHQVKNESHSNTEFLKVQFTITIHIRQIPDFLELFITKPTVPEHRGRLGAVQMRLAI